jgi:hypothetical protein
MAIRCVLGRHYPPDPDMIGWNHDISVGECPKCQVFLIRKDNGAWREVPKNFRVYWRWVEGTYQPSFTTAEVDEFGE